MLELALRNTNTCAQYQPHNLGPCNKSLQCGKCQLDFKPSKVFSFISSHIQLFSKRRRDYTWSRLKTRQLGSHSLRHTVTHSHTQSHTVTQSVSQERNPKLAPFRHSPAASVCLFCNARCTEFQHKSKELKVGGIIPKSCTKVLKSCVPISLLLVFYFCEEESNEETM